MVTERHKPVPTDHRSRRTRCRIVSSGRKTALSPSRPGSQLVAAVRTRHLPVPKCWGVGDLGVRVARHHFAVVKRWAVPRMVGSSQYGGSATGRPVTVLAQVRCAPSLHDLRCPPAGGGAHWLTIAGLVARGGT